MAHNRTVMIEESPPLRQRSWWIVVVIVGGLIGCLGYALNPVGEWRVNAQKEEIQRAVEAIPRGASIEEITTVARRHGLEVGEPFHDPYRVDWDTPKGAYYCLSARHPYTAQYLFGTAYVVVKFWFDEHKRYMSANVDLLGTSL